MRRVSLLIALVLSASAHWMLLRSPRPARAEPELQAVGVVAQPEPERIEDEASQAEPSEGTPPEPATPEPQREPLAPPQPTPEPPAPEHRPPLQRLAETPRAEPEKPGAYAASLDGPTEPTLRIDWGDSQHARRILGATGMSLAVLRGRDAGVEITDSIEPVGDRWHRYPVDHDSLAAFSNRMRIVDDVPAFAEARREARLTSRERLAVLVPASIERMFARAIEIEADRRGLMGSSIASVAGGFSIRDGRLLFEIKTVQTNKVAQ
ncbi:MAG: hypothetical protein AAGB51_06730 [Planctomycetota bacterium]